MNETVRSIGDFDPMSRDVSQCPYAWYSAMRRDAPVYRAPGGFYVASTHAVAQEIFQQPDLFSNTIYGEIIKTPELRAVYLAVPTLSQADPPVHGPLRRVVDRFFTPARINAMEPGIRALANELIDAFIDRGEADLVSEFSLPLALTVLIDALGIDRGLRDTFRQWSNTMRLVPQGVYSSEEEIDVATRIGRVNDYLLELLHERRAAPRDDLISVLATAELEDETGSKRPLPDAQCLSALQQMVGGGFETTSSTISAGIVQMIREPKLLNRLRDEPGYVELFVDETLRAESPIQGLWRRVVRDTTLGGVHLPAGAILNIRIGSANRDDEKFPQAERFDATRRDVSQHLAFGLGIHICVGRMLARKDLKIAYSAIAQRLNDLLLAADAQLEYRHAFLERSLMALPVRFRSRGKTRGINGN
jgi:cytochrome P450